MSRITSQHHCRVVHVQVQDIVRCHCFSPPGTLALHCTGAGGGGKARVVVGSRIADQYSTITTTVVSPDSCRLAGAGSTATGLKMPASPSHHPLPSSFQHRANMSTCSYFRLYFDVI